MGSLILRAGPLSARYSGGSLRGICLEGREILRHVHVALRDHAWNTIPYRLVREEIAQAGQSFRIELTAEHDSGAVNFRWEGVIEGQADGSILWEFAGEAGRPFQRNRIGFCVLHPVETCAGKPCFIEHGDGSRESTFFPRDISPHQPFLDIRAMSYPAGAGLRAELSFTGDTFETEDHRNWTDHSFKTYSTPLALPRPVLVNAGDRVEQLVALRLTQGPPMLACNRGASIAFPELGVTRVDIRFDGTPVPNHEGPVEVAFFTDDPERDLPSCLPALQTLDIRRYLIFSADGAVTRKGAADAARRILGADKIPLGGGTNGNFAELNRNREAVASLDFLSWPISPLIHAEDAETMVENLDGQAPTLACARGFAQGRPLRISQLHVPPIDGSEAWLAASLSHLGAAGAASVAMAAPHPLIDEIAAIAPERLLPVFSSDPLRVYALAAEAKGKSFVWLANLTGQTLTVEWDREYHLNPYEVRRTHREAP